MMTITGMLTNTGKAISVSPIKANKFFFVWVSKNWYIKGLIMPPKKFLAERLNLWKISNIPITLGLIKKAKIIEVQALCLIK